MPDLSDIAAPCTVASDCCAHDCRTGLLPYMVHKTSKLTFNGMLT